MDDLPSRLTLPQAADVLATDLAGIRALIATGRVAVHQVCSGRCETLVERDSVLALRYADEKPPDLLEFQSEPGALVGGDGGI